jgi:hypothetical protein
MLSGNSLSGKKILLFLIALIAFIFILLAAIFVIDRFPKTPKPQNNQPSQESNAKIPIVGNIFLTDSKTNFYLTAILRDVKKKDDSVFVTLETKDYKNNTMTQEFIVLKDNGKNKFYLTLVDNLSSPQEADQKNYTSQNEAYKNLISLKGQVVQSNLYLSGGSFKDFIKPYVSNLKCNDNLYQFLTGGITKKPNCLGIAIQINAEN